jgi:hypothetical protein
MNSHADKSDAISTRRGKERERPQWHTHSLGTESEVPSKPGVNLVFENKGKAPPMAHPDYMDTNGPWVTLFCFVTCGLMSNEYTLLLFGYIIYASERDPEHIKP